MIILKITENMRRPFFVRGLLSSSFSSHGCKMVVAPLVWCLHLRQEDYWEGGKPHMPNFSLLSNQANTFQKGSLDDSIFALIGQNWIIWLSLSGKKLENQKIRLPWLTWINDDLIFGPGHIAILNKSGVLIRRNKV